MSEIMEYISSGELVNGVAVSKNALLLLFLEHTAIRYALIALAELEPLTFLNSLPRPFSSFAPNKYVFEEMRLIKCNVVKSQVLEESLVGGSLDSPADLLLYVCLLFCFGSLGIVHSQHNIFEVLVSSS